MSKFNYSAETIETTNNKQTSFTIGGGVLDDNKYPSIKAVSDATVNYVKPLHNVCEKDLSECGASGLASGAFYSWDIQKVIRSGNICSIYFAVAMNKISPVTAWGEAHILTLPVGYRPSIPVYCSTCMDGGNREWTHNFVVIIRPDGAVYVHRRTADGLPDTVDWSSLSAGHAICVSQTYITTDAFPS